MMVKEQVVVFDPGDIRRIRLVCHKCQGEFSKMIPQGEYKLPDHCPNPDCNERWWESKYSPEGRIKAAVDLLYALNKLATPSNGTAPLKFGIQLEMEG